MHPTGIFNRTSVFTTPWFELVGKSVGEESLPHYSISTRDYVSVLATTRENALILVRQFRPAVEMISLELPSGHVDEGETPEAAARKELREETGFVADSVIHLGTLSPDTGRLSNQLWCFYMPRATRDLCGTFEPERGIEPVVYERGLRKLILDEPAFSSALNRATILMAVARGLLEL